MAPGIEASGGSAANTVAGVASFGGKAAYIGKVAADTLGEVFIHDIRAGGVTFNTAPLQSGAATARCLINVTPDGQRTMSTFLGASVHLTPADVDADLIKGAHAVYLEGYLFDAPDARAAFVKAAEIARDAGRMIAMTLSDAFVVDRHRAALLPFIESEIDLVFANEVETMALFETDDFDAAAAALAKKVKIAAITRGEHGSVVLSDGQVQTGQGRAGRQGDRHHRRGRPVRRRLPVRLGAGPPAGRMRAAWPRCGGRGDQPLRSPPPADRPQRFGRLTHQESSR